MNLHLQKQSERAGLSNLMSDDLLGARPDIQSVPMSVRFVPHNKPKGRIGILAPCCSAAKLKRELQISGDNGLFRDVPFVSTTRHFPMDAPCAKQLYARRNPD